MKFSISRCIYPTNKIFRTLLQFFILLCLDTCVLCIMTGEDGTNRQIPSLPIPQTVSTHREVNPVIVSGRNDSHAQESRNGREDHMSVPLTDLTHSQKDISKRNAIVDNQNARSYIYPGGGGGYGVGGGPFCYDRYVKGNCRYRMDPTDCFSYEWTAYATIQLTGGISNLYSIPEGLYLPDVHNTRDRVRVFLKVSCCTPVVQFISSGTWRTQENSCVVDVRELQGLHPGEIAGIVIAAVVLLIIIIVIIALIVRKRRRDQMPILVGRAHVGPANSRDREMARQ